MHSIVPIKLISYESGLAILETDGHIDFQIILAAHKEVVERHDSTLPLRILSTDLGSDFNPSSERMRRLVAGWNKIFADIPSVRIAAVVTSDHHFGLGRMLTVFSDKVGPAFFVFRQKEDALRWLAGDEPDQQRSS